MPKRQDGQVRVEEHVVFGNGGGRDLRCDVFHPPVEGTGRVAVLLLHADCVLGGEHRQRLH